MSDLEVSTIVTDEYFGIPHEHPESYHTFMYKYFFSHVNVHPRNIHILNGSVTDLEAECVPTGKKVPKMAPTVGVQIVLEVRKAGAQKVFALQNYIEGGGNHMQTLSSLQLHTGHDRGLRRRNLESEVKTVKVRSPSIF
ncbi:glucosamine-6-phosphate deaminase [Marssonina coronariae]|uniref:Glucosamine-6-phosphate deaminase n=1 Tax=Diplocarpon coronariae TaxID=2795749 RepID=A0A218Z9Z3_9HELO|nr:glucosamine-6-phosphate deaminase [Marssonina coronariae]